MRVIIETSWDVVTLCGFFSFVVYFQYAIFTTIWYTYITKLYPSTTLVLFGAIVAVHGIGHCLGAFYLANWTRRNYRTKYPMTCGYCLLLFGDILFLFADFIPTSFVIVYFFIIRFIGGIGMGITCCLRTTITAHSKIEDRAKAMSIFIGGRALGLVSGPGLQLIFLYLGEIGWNVYREFQVHSNNAPAIISIILNLSAIAALFLFFHEVENGSFCSQRSMEVVENFPTPDRIAMFVCMLTRYAQNFTYFSIETLAPAFIMMMYNVGRQNAVGSMSVVLFVSGVVSICFYLIFSLTDAATQLNIRKSNTVALLAFSAYLLATYQWQFLETHVPIMTEGSIGGCNQSRYSWCEGLTKTSLEIFYIGFILTFGASVPFINVTDATLYSTLFNPVGQAVEQSLYDVSQIIARCVAPIVSMVVYSFFGPRRVWELLLVQLVVVTSFWITFAHRLVPLRPKPRPIFYLE
ncbi:unnamed protein product [Caenorhabditis bovis]|uniref:Major facilitator superfamily (MFS) profile domain-containing protein n=1 Tax=Caenorhabditis bovis TaxID=2654633 RepID=A0A8S1EDA2_9PELO|nr:unnamed protein product [Caenorhabditis bovis]